MPPMHSTNLSTESNKRIMAKQEEHFETPDKRGTAIKQGAKNKEPEMTMEEYLLSQLDTPVVLN